MAEEIREYDNNKNLVYYKSIIGEFWFEYDENNNIIHHKNTYNNEYWWKYDENNEKINITQQEFKQIERIKLYLNNKKINRFEIMDI